MKRGFTLVEMLIVVVVLVTLMTMMFKLGSIGGSSSKRNVTIAKLQKLENCLSGYYAAFGTYPPVNVHGSRNPYLTVSSHGIQNMDGNENKDILNWDAEQFRRGEWNENEARAWEQVQAACKAQPVDCRFPFPEGFDEYVEAHSEILQQEAEDSTTLSSERKKVFTAGFESSTKNIGKLSPYQNKTEWRDLQLFKFGLMSFLLPRYLVMMKSDDSLYEDYAQWTGNNKLPCDPLTGMPYNRWSQICHYSTSNQRTDLAKVSNIPSQAVCARWMPNLENIVYTAHSTRVFGIDITEGSDSGFSFDMEVYSPGGFDNDSTAGQYVLDFCTVRDGWWREFYYYSPAPYQSYVLWSAGPNGRTFPPWISREGLTSKENECVSAWVEDDIVNMSN